MDENNSMVTVAVSLMFLVFVLSLVGKSCAYDRNRMEHVASCLEQGREAAECEVIK